MASFNGRFFDGGYSGQTGKRNYIHEQISNTIKQLESLRDVLFFYDDYSNLTIPDDSIVYCDPPYKNTKQYSTSSHFNHDNFWQWCREKIKDHKIFISEYNAPNDFIDIWSSEINNSMHTTNTKKVVEKLFVHESQYQKQLDMVDLFS